MSGAKTPIVEPLPTKEVKARKKVYPKTDDAGLQKALKKDLTEKNITD